MTDIHAETINLWARVGVSLRVTPEEANVLSGPDYNKAKELLLSILHSDKCSLDGETYFPSPNDIALTSEEEKNIPEISWEFDFYNPLHPQSEKNHNVELVPMPGIEKFSEHDFSVQTPHGELHVYDKRDNEYPGVWVDLKQPDGHDITLAMVEYISGGEGISDYDPGNPSLMQRQREEVPPCRREGDTVSAGFVTRSWPDETHNEDDHNRTFHHGYPIPRQMTLEDKVSDAQKRTEKPNVQTGEKSPDR